MLFLAQRAGLNVILETEDPNRALANREGPLRDKWGQQPLEALATRKHTANFRDEFGIDRLAHHGRDGLNQVLGVGRFDGRVELLALAMSIDLNATVRIGHDLHHVVI